MSIASDLRELLKTRLVELPDQDALDSAVQRPMFLAMAAMGLVIGTSFVVLHFVQGRLALAVAVALMVALIAGCFAWALARREYSRPLQLMIVGIFVLLAWSTLRQGAGVPGSGRWLAVLPLILAGAGFFRLAVGTGLAFLIIVSLMTFVPEQVAAVFIADPVNEPWRVFTAIVGSELLTLALVLVALSARRRSGRALVAARQAATEAAAVQARFVARMSHEIRTPLSGIIGAAELLDSPRLSEAQRAQLLSLQRQSAMTLQALLNDVLDLAKLDAGRVTLEERPLFLRGIVFEANELFSVPAFAKGIELSSSCSANVPQSFLGDPTRLRQIVNNLVSNAVKFTARGGVHIHLSVDDNDAHSAAAAGRRQVRIEVSDSGAGIAPAQLKRLFHAFHQADESITRRYGGTGLGLSIALELARLMGGDIEVRSTLGEGSSFTLVLPLAVQGSTLQPTPAALPGVPSAPITRRDVLLACANPGLERHLRSLLHELRIEPLALQALPDETQLEGCSLLLLDAPLLTTAAHGDGAAWLHAQAGAGRRVALLTPLGAQALPALPTLAGENLLLYKPVRRRALENLLVALDLRPAAALEPEAHSRPRLQAQVLVVEDDAVNQVVIPAMVAQTGASCVLAVHGAEALACLKAEVFDLVLMDLHLPQMDGAAVVRAWRAHEAANGLRRTPVLAMTASTDDGERALCTDAGMDGLLAKPFSLAALRLCLHQWLVPAEPAQGGAPAVASDARSTTRA